MLLNSPSYNAMASRRLDALAPGAKRFKVRIGDKTFTVEVEELRPREAAAPRAPEGRAPSVLTAPMPGTVTAINARPGDRVAAGQALLTMESMKMETKICAPKEGVVKAIHVRVGERVQRGAALAEIE